MTTISQPEEIIKMISSLRYQLVASLPGSRHDDEVTNELLVNVKKKENHTDPECTIVID